LYESANLGKSDGSSFYFIEVTFLFKAATPVGKLRRCYAFFPTEGRSSQITLLEALV
jgi:hypothetical protein